MTAWFNFVPTRAALRPPPVPLPVPAPIGNGYGNEYGEQVTQSDARISSLARRILEK